MNEPKRITLAESFCVGHGDDLGWQRGVTEAIYAASSPSLVHLFSMMHPSIRGYWASRSVAGFTDEASAWLTCETSTTATLSDNFVSLSLCLHDTVKYTLRQYELSCEKSKADHDPLTVMTVILSLSLLMGVSSVSVPVPDQALDYVFSYGVNDDKSGSSFGHHETTDGQKTAGEYRVALPDGRLQVVKYTADENGYNAVVTYEGVATHPDQDPHAPTSPAPAVVTTVHPPTALAPTHPPAVLPAPTRPHHAVPSPTPPTRGPPVPTHRQIPPHPSAFPAPLPVPSNDIHRLPGPAFAGHFPRPEPVRPRPQLISVNGEPIGQPRGPVFPHLIQGPQHSEHIRPHAFLQFGPGHPAVAERPPPADLSLFVPEEDLHKADFPSLLSNAVPLHFGNAVPLPVTPIPQHHVVVHPGNPLPLRPISRHHGTPIPHSTTPVSHHVTPVPHHVDPSDHHVTPVPHVGSFVHDITPIHDVTRAPHHGKQISHHVNPAAHHNPVVHHIKSVPHNVPAHVVPGPALPNSVPLLPNSSPFHVGSVPLHNGLLPVTPSPGLHHGHEHVPHHPTSLPHHPTLTPHHTSSIAHHSSPIPHHTSPITHHPTTIPHHTLPITHHTSPIIHHSTPLPHHSSPILPHSNPIPHHSSPLPGLHQSVSFHPPASIQDKGVRRAKSFRNILGGSDIPPFLPGAPTLDRGQYLRHKGLDRPGRSPLPTTESEEE
ncbi:pollen-specific leucine-rich repeat extensin-like protein 1 [Penaeus monodon]|uniref:pollen-specific leucine-rich repeat extensin-like protein 1 n=1 Tax=Penaeus monodon TaxID=6687 RepID=UPI0018A71A82|nr:pollen-specific leucine-rich repeat extensin-like protein 1 [Penaeus monodon]